MNKNIKFKISMTFLLIAVMVILMSSCKTEECKCEIERSQVVLNDSIISQATEFEVEKDLTVYKRYFNQFNKAELFLKKNESYRLTINPSLWNFAKIYELENKSGRYVLQIEEFSKSQNGTKEISTYNTKSIELTVEEWNSFKIVFDENCFWLIKSDIEEDNSYLDGTSWVLEGVNGNNNCTNSNFHLISRTSPDSSAFLNICNEFLKFDSLNIRNINEW